MMLALFMLAMALLIAWRRLSCEHKTVFAVAIVAYALMGSAMSIVLGGLSP